MSCAWLVFSSTTEPYSLRSNFPEAVSSSLIASSSARYACVRPSRISRPTGSSSVKPMCGIIGFKNGQAPAARRGTRRGARRAARLQPTPDLAKPRGWVVAGRTVVLAQVVHGRCLLLLCGRSDRVDGPHFVHPIAVDESDTVDHFDEHRAEPAFPHTALRTFCRERK